MRWLWMGMGALMVAPLIAIPAFIYGSAKGKQDLKTSMLEERLVTKEQIDALDEIVFDADESALCGILGGC